MVQPCSKTQLVVAEESLEGFHCRLSCLVYLKSFLGQPRSVPYSVDPSTLRTASVEYY